MREKTCIGNVGLEVWVLPSESILRYTDQETEAESAGKTGLVKEVVAQPGGKPGVLLGLRTPSRRGSVSSHEQSHWKTCRLFGPPAADLTGYDI